MDASTDRAFQEVLESELLEHVKIIEAMCATEVDQPTLAKQSELRDWAAVRQNLEALAFQVEASCPWHVIPKEEGPSPTLHGIERRAYFATLLTSVHKVGNWTDVDVAAALQFEQTVERARQTCATDPRSVLRSRKK